MINNANHSSLTICTWNCRGVSNKYHELELFLRTHDIDILLLTETKLKITHQLKFTGYNVIRSDHPSGTRQGGSAVIVNNRLNFDELPAINENEF